ncbi:MAG: two-component system response regulator, partial [Limisphaerales bacterium]
MQCSPPISVLLVDDRPDKLLALESMLAPLGYRIQSATSGKEALRALLQERFHLVILDVN